MKLKTNLPIGVIIVPILVVNAISDFTVILLIKLTNPTLLVVFGILSLPVLIFIIITYCIIKMIVGKIAVF